MEISPHPSGPLRCHCFNLRAFSPRRGQRVGVGHQSCPTARCQDHSGRCLVGLTGSPRPGRVWRPKEGSGTFGTFVLEIYKVWGLEDAFFMMEWVAQSIQCLTRHAQQHEVFLKRMTMTCAAVLLLILVPILRHCEETTKRFLSTYLPMPFSSRLLAI